LAFTNNCSQSYKFAGMEQDSETGEYHTQFRQYTSNLGRWLSPDPSGTAAVSLANPQTWNMYAYVTNNPSTLTDPTGLQGTGECYEYYCNGPIPLPQFEASYGGPPPGVVCGTAWCMGSNGVWVWNEPTPLGSELAQALAAYVGWVIAMWQTGGSYSVWTANHGWVTYTVGWSMDTGAFWIGPNGVPLSPEAVQEAQLPALAGASSGGWGVLSALILMPQGWLSSQGNGTGLQIGSWNVSHPSAETCGKVKKVAIGTLVAGGGLLSVGTLFPVTAPVTHTFGIPLAINGGIFGLYCVAFCSSW
jgi:RHS repeat-associated protein